MSTMRPLSLSFGTAISHLAGDGVDERAKTFVLRVEVVSDEWHCAPLS